MDNVTVQDLITLAYEQQPIEFKQSFNDLVADRLVRAIDDRKHQVAQTMFKQPDNESDTEQTY